MNKPAILWQLALADVRERTRRYSFLVAMLGVLFFGYLVITGKYTVQFGDCRTVYDAVWAGHLMAVCSSIMLTLIGFYLIKGSITRDRRTEVGQIIAATRLSKSSYIFAKFIGNIIVLWLMAAVLALMGFITLLFRNEAATINLWSFVSPFLIITLPTTIFVAAMAVFFDSVRRLRGSAGNVVYLFLAEACIILGMLELRLLDLGAVTLFTDSVRAAARIAFPGEKISLIMGFVALDPAMKVEHFRIFDWNGINWTTDLLMFRMFWIGVAFAAVNIAVPFFDRFDPATITRTIKRKKKKQTVAETADETVADHPQPSYQELPQVNPAFSFFHMLQAELRLALKGFHWFWYVVAAGLVVAQLVAPFEVGRLYLAPGAMIWPLVIWSSMGNRERRFNTGQLLFSSSEPLARQFPAVWASGLVVALIAVGGMVFRAVIAGEFTYVIALLTGALFVPTAALAFGTLSGSRKLFEVSYLMIWYVGSIEHLATIDLLGATPDAVTGGKMATLVILSIFFLVTAFAARRVQVVQG